MSFTTDTFKLNIFKNVDNDGTGIKPRSQHSGKFRGTLRGYGDNYYRYLSTDFDISMKT